MRGERLRIELVDDRGVLAMDYCSLARVTLVSKRLDSG